MYKAISLFCGAGGLDLGFERAGIKIIWANDFNHDACETHKSWSDAEVVEGDIGKIDISEIPSADVVLGGFPCQGFSLAGPRKIDDSRNTLYRYFVKVVEQKKPKMFVAENVKGILTLGDGFILDAIIRDFRSKGYRVMYKLLNASDYGVPQSRERVVIVGIRDDLRGNFKYPKPLEKEVFMGDVLLHFPKPSEDEVCQDAFSSRYMSRNRKRNWNEVSFTIPATAKQVPLHPSSPDMIKKSRDIWVFGEGETRRLSYKEAAVIQTFPETIEFSGNLTSKYKQIGNAVPVLLAEAIGKEVYEFLERINNGNI